jgi:hypothetical protein
MNEKEKSESLRLAIDKDMAELGLGEDRQAQVRKAPDAILQIALDSADVGDFYRRMAKQFPNSNLADHAYPGLNLYVTAKGIRRPAEAHAARAKIRKLISPESN